MALLKIVTLLVLATACAQGCKLDQQSLTVAAAQCASHNPFLMAQMAEQMEATDPAAKFALVCNHKAEIVDIFFCVMKGMEKCIPAQFKMAMKAFPSRDHMLDGVRFMCEHKKMMTNNCMDDHIQPVMQCYTSRVMQTIMSAKQTGSMDVQGMVCGVVHSMETCLDENRGSCGKDFIRVVKQFLETFYSMSECPKVAVGGLEQQPDRSQSRIKSILKNILIHGQPQSLKFNPSQYKPYVIKN